LYVTVTVRHWLFALDGQGASEATHVMVVLAVPQVPLFIHPTSVPDCASAVETAVDDATIPARAPSAAAWVIVAWVARIRPYEMMPYSNAIRSTTTKANSTISAPCSSSRRRLSLFGILHARVPNVGPPPLDVRRRR